MPWPMLASAGISLLGGLFGGRKQRAGYEFAPEEKSLLAQLKGQIGKVPGYVTAPFVQMGKAVKQKYARQPGMGQVLSAERKKVANLQAEAAGAYDLRQKSLLASLVGGRGTQVATEGAPWGDILGGIGGDIGLLWGLEKMLGMGGQGAGRKVD